jgi:hypothetical protein
MAAVGKHRIRNHAHEPYIAAAVDEPNPAPREFATDVPCGICIRRIRSVAGAAEHADTFE